MFDYPSKDASLEGIIFATAIPGKTKHVYIMPYDRIFNGIQQYSNQKALGDNVSFRLYIKDKDGVYKLYKKLSKKWYVAPCLLNEVRLYPARPKKEMKLEFEYENTGSEDVLFFINAYMHRDVNVDINKDW